MQKFLLITLLFFVSILNIGWTKKPPKCNCPIYFFEETSKDKIFEELDIFLQKENIIPKKFYPELTFISFDYKLPHEKPEIVSFNVKQFGYDTYLFIGISKSNSDLETKLYSKLKNSSKNSYLLRDDLFCKEFKKDIKAINKNKKTLMKETQYNPSVYQFDMQRYVGYKKKKYLRKKKKDKQEKL